MHDERIGRMHDARAGLQEPELQVGEGDDLAAGAARSS